MDKGAEISVGDGPLISVIVPAMGRERALSRAIDSIRRQTYRNLEIVVVDDASPVPLSPARLKIDDARLRVIRREANGGPGAARNTGVGQARGEIIAFLDSDDEWRVDKLAKQVDVLIRDRNEGGRLAGAVSAYNLQTPDSDGSADSEVRYPGPVNEIGRLVWGCDLSPGATLMVWRGIFDEIGMFDERLRRLEDWDWLIRVARRYQMASVPEPLAVVHLSGRAGYPAVKSACEILRQRHKSEFASLSPAYLLRFRSTLALELAMAALASGARLRALRHAIECFILWPWRNGAFYRRAFRHLLSFRRLPPKG